MRNRILQPLSTALLAGTLMASEARSQSLAPAAIGNEPTRSERRPREFGLGALEIGTGVALGVAGMGGAIAVADWDHEHGLTLAAVTVLALPALQGLAICGVGSLSHHYQGGCAWPIGAAYLGSVALVPLAFVFGNGSDGPLEGAVTLIAGVALGVLIGAPVGATWAWNANKTWRSPEASPLRSASVTPGAFRSVAVSPAAFTAMLPGPAEPRARSVRLLGGEF